MFLQEAPADTLDFMLYGFAVILGTIAIFIASLATRFRNLQKDLEVMDEVERGQALEVNEI
jgi:TRAP-type C4-dicarboxylate transport system permease small subunit